MHRPRDERPIRPEAAVGDEQVQMRTERYAAEQLLRASEGRQRLALDAAELVGDRLRDASLELTPAAPVWDSRSSHLA